MAYIPTSSRGSFGSKFGIIAAAAGSAIGLGNIWRFPYVTGESGGGAFLLIYLGFILLIGLPVMLSEFVIGRSTNRNPYGAFKQLKPNQPWYLIGIMGILGAFFILAFYGAVGGWTIEYLVQSAKDSFANKNPEGISRMFTDFQEGGIRPVIFQLSFMALTMLVVVAGIEKGIEKYTKILMPVLFLLIIVICIRSITLKDAEKGLHFLFNPDFSKLSNPDMLFGVNYPIILEALGQAFFSLSIGMGTLITYGSYINKRDNLGSSAFVVSLTDTFIAILAGVAIFPAVFAFGIEPDAGPALVFETLPNIFQKMPGGYYFGLMFFVLLLIAALTSSISVLEVVVAFSVEQFNITRKKATIIAGVLIAILGVFCALSGIKEPIYVIGKKTIFDVLEIAATKFILPLGGLFIILFIGWFYDINKTKLEMSNQGTLKIWYYNAYIFLVRYIAPLAIIAVFVYGIVNLDAKSE